MNTETIEPKSSVNEAKGEAGLAASGLLDALERFLENHGDDFLRWDDGRIVIETYYDTKFRALGGDTDRLISFFEDYMTMHDAARNYLAAIRKASNDKSSHGAGRKE